MMLVLVAWNEEAVQDKSENQQSSGEGDTGSDEESHPVKQPACAWSHSGYRHAHPTQCIVARLSLKVPHL